MDKDKLITSSADVLVPFIASLDPLWADEIAAMKAERGFDNIQVIGALAGYTLMIGGHMWVPPHPFFEDNHHAAGTRMNCPVCDKEWILAYPNQPVCSNNCAAAYYAKKEMPSEDQVKAEAHRNGHQKVRRQKAAPEATDD